MSLFISFEGGEGAGKSTQAKILADRLNELGLSVLQVQEPGSTPLGQHLRQWLKEVKDISPEAELLLFCAARAELVSKVIRPALSKNKIVITDRFIDSTVAYQGYGRGINQKHIAAANQLATQGLTPDITFLLDCPPEKGIRRALQVSMNHTSKGNIKEGRRFEDESLEFHNRIRNGYLEIANRNPKRITVIDATKSLEDVGLQIWTVVNAALNPKKTKVSR